MSSSPGENVFGGRRGGRGRGTAQVGSRHGKLGMMSRLGVGVWCGRVAICPCLFGVGSRHGKLSMCVARNAWVWCRRGRGRGAACPCGRCSSPRGHQGHVPAASLLRVKVRRHRAQQRRLVRVHQRSQNMPHPILRRQRRRPPPRYPGAAQAVTQPAAKPPRQRSRRPGKGTLQAHPGLPHHSIQHPRRPCSGSARLPGGGQGCHSPMGQ